MQIRRPDQDHFQNVTETSFSKDIGLSLVKIFMKIRLVVLREFANRQTDRQTETDKQADRQRQRQTDRQTERQTDRQTPCKT